MGYLFSRDFSPDVQLDSHVFLEHFASGVSHSDNSVLGEELGIVSDDSEVDDSSFVSELSFGDWQLLSADSWDFSQNTLDDFGVESHGVSSRLEVSDLDDYFHLKVVNETVKDQKGGI